MAQKHIPPPGTPVPKHPGTGSVLSPDLLKHLSEPAQSELPEQNLFHFRRVKGKHVENCRRQMSPVIDSKQFLMLKSLDTLSLTLHIQICGGVSFCSKFHLSG